MKPHEYMPMCLEFKKVFHVPFTDFADKPLFAIEWVTIDLCKFEAWLQDRHPYDDDTSMEEAVQRHYGRRGVELIEKLLQT